MNNRAHLVANLLIAALFIAYGVEALKIPLFPGQEHEAFKPRTMPVTLAAAGLLLCVIRLVQLARTRAPLGTPDLARLRWGPAALLCAVMVGYGLLLVPAGFVLATSLFLGGGFAVLGERRPAILVALPLVFSAIFYLLMTRLLGLYLSPGLWWG